jgi:hypothetical protein
MLSYFQLDVFGNSVNSRQESENWTSCTLPQLSQYFSGCKILTTNMKKTSGRKYNDGRDCKKVSCSILRMVLVTTFEQYFLSSGWFLKATKFMVAKRTIMALRNTTACFKVFSGARNKPRDALFKCCSTDGLATF